MSWLHNKRPIVISADLAMHVGLNEAIILQQLNYWLENTSSGVEHDGLRWVYNTQKQWQEQFPFWSTDTVKRALTSLKKQDLILTAKLAKDKHDRTNYYTVNHARLEEMQAAARDFPHQCKMHQSNSAKSANGSGQSAPMDQGNLPSSIGASCPHVTETTTETTTEITTDTFADGVAAQPQSAELILSGDLSEAVVTPKVKIPDDMPGPKDQTCKTFKTWANYAIKYRKRYHAWPVWNSSVGGVISKIIDRLGIDVAHSVAAYYVEINDAQLIRQCHSLKTLLAGAEGYHTQWATQTQMNGTTARQKEQTQANINAAQEASRNIRDGGKQNAFLRPAR